MMKRENINLRRRGERKRERERRYEKLQDFGPRVLNKSNIFY